MVATAKVGSKAVSSSIVAPSIRWWKLIKKKEYTQSSRKRGGKTHHMREEFEARRVKMKGALERVVFVLKRVA